MSIGVAVNNLPDIFMSIAQKMLFQRLLVQI